MVTALGSNVKTTMSDKKVHPPRRDVNPNTNPEIFHSNEERAT